MEQRANMEKQEIERRVATLESGSTELESWDDAKRRIERDILGR